MAQKKSPSALIRLLACAVVMTAAFTYGYGQQHVQSATAPAAVLTPVAGPAIEGMTHSAWSRRDGVPGGISSLAQTRDGYLWIGSTLGLYRFDGLRFVEYPFSSNAQPLPSLEVSSVSADPNGGLWVSFRNPAIVHILPEGNQETFLASDGLTANMLEKVMARPDGSVYAFGGSQLFRLEGHHWVNFGRDHGLKGGGVFSVFFDKDENIWIGRDKKLFVLHKGAKVFEETPDQVHYISSMVQSRTGELWVADAWRNVRPLSNTSATGPYPIRGKAEMMMDSKDNLWIAEDDQGLSRIQDISSPTFPKKTEHAVPEEISDLRTHALLEDREGNIWLGTDRGLDRFQQRIFMPFRETQLHYFPSLVAADDGSIWINSHGSPLLRVKDGVTTPIGQDVNTGPLAKKSNGDICLVHTTTNVLQCYSGTRLRETPLDDRLQHDPPLNMIADKDDSLLASFFSRGLWRYSGEHWEPVTGDGLPKGDAWGMLKDSKGDIWLGYNDNHIVQRSGGKYRGFDVEGGAWTSSLSFYEADGTIWVAGASGLAFLHQGRVLVVHPFQPNLFRGSSGIAEDRFGNLWLNSAAGALRIPADEIHQLLTTPDHLTKAEVFDDNDGLSGQPTQSKRTPSVISDRGGTLWFATGGGVVSLDPALVLKPRPLPVVRVENVAMYGDSISTGTKPIRITSTQLHDLAISYIGINLSAPERVFYRYRLVGEEDAWQDAGNRRQAFYTRLRPGTYQFEVSASNGQGWSELSTPLQIAVVPAFYQTWYFRLICVVLAIWAISAVIRVRARYAADQVRERFSVRMSERERVARELHDTLLQGFQGLLLRFDAVRRSLPERTPITVQMEDALASGDALLVEGRDKIKDLRYETLDRDSLVQSLEKLGLDWTTATKNHFEVTVAGTPQALNPVSYQDIYGVVKEAFVNSVRHSAATKITIRIDYRPTDLSLEVIDDGCGMDASDQEKRSTKNHWGIAGMRERAANLNANLKIASAKGVGTSVLLRIPARIGYQRKKSDG
jgi:signal transduction histidine kinase/ligand-binding sensor domain-containing protein